MTESVTFTATLEFDPETGDLVLPFSDELIEQLGWNVGDTLDWKDNGDGTFTLTRIDK
jgi:hypothetical protein